MIELIFRGVKLEEESFGFYVLIIAMTVLQCIGLADFIWMLIAGKIGCLSYSYALPMFSLYYLVFMAILVRGGIILARTYFSNQRQIYPSEFVEINQSYVGPIESQISSTYNDPLDFGESEIGKFNFRKFIQELEKNPKTFSYMDFVKKNSEAIKLLPVSRFELRAYNFIFVSKFKARQDQQLTPGSEEVCSVCVEGFREGEELLRLSDCVHTYHWDCIKMWLLKKRECPLCSQDMRLDMLKSIVKYA